MQSISMEKITRVIEVFEKGKDERIKEEILLDPSSINITELQVLFTFAEDNPPL